MAQINAGTNQSSMIGAADLEGNDRIVNGTVDIGAFEYMRPSLPSIALVFDET